MKKQEQSVILRLVCLQPPGGQSSAGSTIFGLQDRSQQIYVGEAQSNGSVVYEVVVPVKRHGDTDIARLTGPYIHGAAAVPFLYLSLKLVGEEPASWIRRLKIPLPALSWQQLVESAEPALFVGRVEGTRSGTVPLLDGTWLRQS